MSFLSLRNNPIELKTSLSFDNSDVEPDPLKRHLRFIEKQMSGFVVKAFFGEDIKNKVADDTFQPLLKECESFLEKNLFSECNTICKAIIIYSFTYIGNDKKGSDILEDYANQACSLLLRMIEKGIEDSGKLQLYEYLKSVYQKITGAGVWYVPDHFLEMFPLLILSKEMETDFFSFVESMKLQRKNEKSNYRLFRRLIGEKINYLENLGRNDEAIQEIESNCDDSDFLKMLIQVEIRNGNYGKANALSLEATVKFCEYNRYGTWDKLLLEIALKTDDKDSVRFYAERLYRTSYRSMEYYRILKSTYHDNNEWTDFVENLLNSIGITRKFRYNAILTSAANILAEEGYSDRLCELLKDPNANPEFINNYSSFISSWDPLKLLEIFREIIIKYANKPGYRTGERFLRSFEIMKDLPGGAKVVEETAEYLLNAHPERIQMVACIQKLIPGINS